MSIKVDDPFKEICAENGSSLNALLYGWIKLFI